jgi:ankyrin repeat protein
MLMVERAFTISIQSTFHFQFTRFLPDRALHWAVDREHHELAELLLTQYSANANIQDVEGQTCLHVACVCEHFELIRMLRAHGADPHVADASGETPLMLASNNTDLLTILQV